MTKNDTFNDLERAVKTLACEPTDVRQADFHRCLVLSSLAIEVPSALEPGQHVTSSELTLEIPRVLLPDNTNMLVVFANAARLTNFYRDIYFGEIAAKNVLHMASNGNAGIIVKIDMSEDSAWAGVLPGHVEELLKGHWNEGVE